MADSFGKQHKPIRRVIRRLEPSAELQAAQIMQPAQSALKIDQNQERSGMTSNQNRNGDELQAWVSLSHQASTTHSEGLTYFGSRRSSHSNQPARGRTRSRVSWQSISAMPLGGSDGWPSITGGRDFNDHPIVECTHHAMVARILSSACRRIFRRTGKSL